MTSAIAMPMQRQGIATALVDTGGITKQRDARFCTLFADSHVTFMMALVSE
jgi:hypothetical protein